MRVFNLINIFVEENNHILLILLAYEARQMLQTGRYLLPPVQKMVYKHYQLLRDADLYFIKTVTDIIFS